MKVIQFRAWNGKTMDYDYRDVSLWHGLLVAEGDTILLQWTGLKDKHGKEIYEGDIVKNGIYAFNGIVFFENGSFWVREYLSHVDEGLYDDREKETRWSINLDWEIIGNIYEDLALEVLP